LRIRKCRNRGMRTCFRLLRTMPIYRNAVCVMFRLILIRPTVRIRS
jgi:hypothetical protein